MNMADSDDGMLNWTMPCQATSGGSSNSSTSHQEQQAREANGLTAAARHSWSNSSPSNNSGSTERSVPSSSARQDGSSSLDCDSPSESVTTSAPSTAPEGACWNSGLAQFDDSNRAVWPDSDTDSVFAVTQQLQTGASTVNNTAHMPQGGQPYASGSGTSTSSPGATVLNQLSSSSSSVANHSLEACPSGGWNSSGGASRGAATVANTGDITPQMWRKIMSDDGWGKTPIRQDTPWPELDDYNKRRIDAQMWTVAANNGTAIWNNLLVASNGGPSSRGTSIWQDKRSSAVGDRAVPDMSSSWNAVDAGSRIRTSLTSLTPGSSSNVEVRGAISGQGLVNGDSSRDSPPGGSFHEWNSAGMSRPLRHSEGKFSQPGWGGGLQTHRWNHELQQTHPFLGTPGPGLSLQQSQPVGRVDFGGSGSPMPWEQPSHGRSSGSNSALGPTADSEWDANGAALGAGSYPWPLAESTGSSQRPPKMMLLNRDESGAEFPSGPRRSSVGHGVAAKSSGGASSMHQLPMRQQLIQNLCDMGYSRESAQKALIDNDMDLTLALADLNRSLAGSSQQGSHQSLPRALLAPQDAGSVGGGLMAAPFQLYAGSVNTHGNNAQSAATGGGKSFMHLPSGRQPQPIAPLPGLMAKMPRQPLGNQYLSAAASGWSSRGASQQQALHGVQGLIHHGFISQNALKQQNVAIIEEMVRLYALYQSCQQTTSRSMSQMSSQQRDQLESIRQKLTALGQCLREPLQRHSTGVTSACDAVTDEFLNLSLSQPYMPPLQTQSKLSQWKMPSECESGVLSQASRAPGSKPVSSSCTLAGPGNSGDDAWSVSGRPKLDANHNESQPSADDFQIPEFIPGQMWTGGMSMTADDAQLPSSSSTFFGGAAKSEEGGGGSSSSWSTYAGIQRSISVPGGVWPPTSANAAGAVASSAAGSAAVGAAGVDWSTSAPPRTGASVAPARPPPGLVNYGPIGQSVGSGGYGRRSSTSASWSPSTAGSASGVIGSHWEQVGSRWVALHNLPSQMDQARLRSLCSQHGTVLAFYPNPGYNSAFVQYRCAQEAANAQNNLHCCVITNCTIQAQVVGEEEVRAFVDRSPSGSSMAYGGGGGGGLHSMSAWSTGAPPSAVTAPSTWSTGGGTAPPTASGLSGIHFGNVWPGGAAGVDGSCM